MTLRKIWPDSFGGLLNTSTNKRGRPHATLFEQHSKEVITSPSAFPAGCRYLPATAFRQ